MNVQTPLQTPPTRDDGLDEDHGGHARTYVIGGVALALVLGGFWYFTHDSGAPKAKRNLAAPVKVAPVEVGDMAVIEHTIGTVMANSTVQINARVNGQLVKAFFKEGQMVKTGDPLFEIDPRPYQAAYDNAVASMVTAKAKAERYGRLKAQNAVAGQDFDDAQAAYLEAKANVESARLNLEYTTIRSPVNGKTGPILIQPGNMVSSTSSSSTSSTTNGISTANPLVTINEIQPVKISLSLPQSDLPRIQAQLARPGGLTIALNMRDLGGDDIKAPVNFVSNAVAGSTGTIELRANYANTDMALVPGQLIDTTVVLSQIPSATLVPRDAVNTGPDGLYVYVVKDGVAQQRTVKLEFDDGVNDAVVGDLKVGEQVVTDGQLRLLPGAKVSVTGTKKHASAGAKGVMTSGRRHVKHASDNEG
ncbi:MAG TPA: efflux RND transporter periplasmic adaptor subunit [Rhizomicrobium sp.]|nr:efflux RND transporter periplasmic adaptor subunit [Rhizomicrobium sp.]